ncbi:hypothetical protein FHS21_005048 [Phyllobacterium trifolii]|jgi:hypothetical protein|uniref:Uncharacterized protein n=1 Tax=Phyllobacterium trifolii TaxID=300193 RepID=A0A839UIA0_9HYPH|nr:hypothetical protein [Phyllobacterium trifolii]
MNGIDDAGELCQNAVARRPGDFSTALNNYGVDD